MFRLRNDLKKLATKSSQQAPFCAPKFPSVLKSLTSRTTLSASNHSNNDGWRASARTRGWSQDRWNKDPNVIEDSRVCLGTGLEPVKPREGEQQASGAGRLAALGHTPGCFPEAPLKSSPFKGPASSSADCAEAGLFLSHVVGPLVFSTERPRFALQTTWKRNGTPSSHAPAPAPTAALGDVSVGHDAPAAVGCACV